MSFLYPATHLLVASLSWLTVAWALRLWKKSSNRLAVAILPILLLSISYDNFVLGTGNIVGAGPLLERLNDVRFFLHDLVIPFFIVIGVEIASGAGARWANRFVKIFSWFLAIGLVSAKLFSYHLSYQLKPEYFCGVLRYVLVSSESVPIVTIAVNAFMLLIAIGVWVRLRWSILFVGTLVGFLGNSIPSGLVGPLPGCTAELILAISLLLTEQRLQSPDKHLPIEDPDFEKNFTWTHILQKDGYRLLQAGSHEDGNFVQAFVPETPQKDADGRLKVIAYLHGFALCLPKFYEAHLEHLATNGYYVLFPDFQKSNYPDELEPNLKSQGEEVGAPISFWWNTLKQRGHQIVSSSAKSALRPSLLKYLRVSLSILGIVLFIRAIFFWLNRLYGKHLIKLLSTVGLSLLFSPRAWNRSAIRVSQVAWSKLGEEYSEIRDSEGFNFYLFGHSLGGLLALSWPKYLAEVSSYAQDSETAHSVDEFMPKQIVVADPAPSTEMGIPGFVVFFLKIFNSPFAEDPIHISDVSDELAGIPVGILHGKDDRIVKLAKWSRKGLFSRQSNFSYIKDATDSSLYASNSCPQKKLIAFHNQSVTDTTYYDNALFRNFGGVKTGVNIYNTAYVWPGLDMVLSGKVQANNLIDFFERVEVEQVDSSNSENLSV